MIPLLALAALAVTWAGSAPGEGNRFGPFPLPVLGLASYLAVAALIARCANIV